MCAGAVGESSRGIKSLSILGDPGADRAAGGKLGQAENDVVFRSPQFLARPTICPWVSEDGLCPALGTRAEREVEHLTFSSRRKAPDQNTLKGSRKYAHREG